MQSMYSSLQEEIRDIRGVQFFSVCFHTLSFRRSKLRFRPSSILWVIAVKNYLSFLRDATLFLCLVSDSSFAFYRYFFTYFEQ